RCGFQDGPPVGIISSEKKISPKIIPIGVKNFYCDGIVLCGQVASTSYTRLCETKEIITVNGQFPGPTLYVNKGDTVIINAFNQGNYSLTILLLLLLSKSLSSKLQHGLKQPRNPWSDGTEYITMCGVPPGKNFTYTLLFSTEEGTIWYHAHSDWTRATVHGAIVIYPRMGTTYPFPKPDKEYVVVLGEWWTSDVMKVFMDGIIGGTDFDNSDAYTVQRLHGYNMVLPLISSLADDLVLISVFADTTQFVVEYGKTYLLRVVNAIMSMAQFFGIANHTLTVVGRDGAYLKPFDREFILVNVAQTVDILVTANQPQGLYYMAASPYSTAIRRSNFDSTQTTAIVEYNGYYSSQASPSFPYLPFYNDTVAAYEYELNLRSLASKEHPIDVPMEIDTRLVYTVSMNELDCNTSACTLDYRLAASMNNISFMNPQIDILEAYYQSIKGVYTTDFPSFPPYMFDFTEEDYPEELVYPTTGTRVKVLKYNSSVELVLQTTNLVLGDYHPVHLHGYHFYVVGQGHGNFDPEKDPLEYNLVDPPEENTVGVPFSGWSALRFRADNPRVWLLHCHFERHYSWGMTAVFIVTDGETDEARLLPPPTGMPNCSDAELITKPFDQPGQHEGDIISV
ncbi:L-ascorbate oxidase, partial [Nymphaea thermarum]